MSTSFSLKAYTQPTQLKNTGLQILGGFCGLVAASAIHKKINPTEGLLPPLAMFGMGAVGLHHYNVKPSKDAVSTMLKALAVGVAVFGGIKSAGIGVNKLSTMSGLGRLGGFLSPATFEKIKNILPTINGMGEIPSYTNDPMASMMGLSNYYTNNYYEPEPPNTVLTARPINGNVEAVDVMAEVL